MGINDPQGFSRGSASGVGVTLGNNDPYRGNASGNVPTAFQSAFPELADSMHGVLQDQKVILQQTQKAIETFSMTTDRMEKMFSGTGRGSFGDIIERAVSRAFLGTGTLGDRQAIPVEIIQPKDKPISVRDASNRAKGNSGAPSGEPSAPLEPVGGDQGSGGETPSGQSSSGRPSDQGGRPTRRPPNVLEENYKSGRSVSGIAQKLDDVTAGWENSSGAKGMAKRLIGGAASGSGGSGFGSGILRAVGIGGEALAIPGVGEVLAGAGMAYGLVEGVGGFMAGQRASNARFQSIEGGSNISGLAERARQQGFQYSQLGMLGGAQADKLFYGVTETGLNGGDRQSALDFAVQNYSQMGMDPNQSLKFIQLAAVNASLNLNQVAGALQNVTDTAAAAGVNTEVARQSFAGMITALTVGGSGPTAGIQAAIATNFANGMGRQTAGLGFNWGSTSSDALLSTFVNDPKTGRPIQGLGNAASLFAANPEMRAIAQERALQSMVIGPMGGNNSAQQALFDKYTPSGKEYKNVTAGGGLGAALLQGPLANMGKDQLLNSLQAAGVSGLDKSTSMDTLLTYYANIASHRGDVSRSGITSIEKSIFKKHLGSIDDFEKTVGIDSDGNLNGAKSWTRAHGGVIDSHQGEFNTYKKVIGDLYKHESGTGMAANVMFNGKAYSAQDLAALMQSGDTRGILSQIHEGHFKYQNDPTATAAVATSRNGSTGGGGKGDGKVMGHVTVGLSPSAQNMLALTLQSQSGSLALTPSNPTNPSNM